MRCGGNVLPGALKSSAQEVRPQGTTFHWLRETGIEFNHISVSRLSERLSQYIAYGLREGHTGH
jgi:hypothetical protein